jgi:hypothetical protein
MTEEELVREVHEMSSQPQPAADPETDHAIKLRMVHAMARDAAAFWERWLNSYIEPPDREDIETARAQFKQIAELIELPMRFDGQ